MTWQWNLNYMLSQRNRKEDDTLRNKEFKQTINTIVYFSIEIAINVIQRQSAHGGGFA